MSAALKEPITLETFLDWESRQESRYEFDGFGPVAITGGSVEHSLIHRNLSGLLFYALKGHRCTAHFGHLKVRVAGRIRYPDAFIVCSPIPPRASVVHDPLIVFEIISPSTDGVDRHAKNREYRATPSIQRYVILEQTLPGAMVFSRDSDVRAGHLVPGDAALELPEAGISLEMEALYEGVTFPPMVDDGR